MYQLTISLQERRAFDFVGDRYATGNNIADILWSCEWKDDQHYSEWEDDTDFTFIIPEHVAWQIREWSEEEGNLWPLFSTELAAKMQRFVEGIT